jgi:uncharacterized membrane protein
VNTLVQPTRAARRPRFTLWLLRAGATLHLVLVLAQPVLAGLFLTGDVDAIEVHAAVATALAFVALGLVVIAVMYLIAGGRLWVLPAMVVLIVAIGLQMAFGYTRVLAIHIPLGVAIVTVAVLLAIWVWTPAAARRRGGAR